ncbi:ABC transporter ATP-binding protein [Sporomusa sphaeroides]|uniref:Daunorubicin/doxorubicin resistance ATP-binding protein DrrA n=2 Tax=Sporomusa TaxID=2375 RepID=A0ABP2C6N7_9FIRM|nr:ABC transporter ATP-binding protein [Sporomusa sphaeroides]OLS56080.1 daunorubicin/doxorubicin resistance ATP-binding protein DrrA [Sporomusa sphaeroides DSM 2875]CVK19278.1 Daunorubicin/doxorubicin resistance ATP-binding protein DrrA [Sporomusa sphaeroides DSM 2875]SCM82671.1 Nod factor export ATP-binding protein I [uncultured Sporomusa sp.]
MSVSRTTLASHREPEAALVLHRLAKTYDKQEILRGISLTVAQGETFGLLGPNGAGKTTLMKLVAGLSRPDGGQLTIFGRDGGGERQGMKQRIALVAQENNLEREFTVQEALLTYARLYGVAKPRQRVEELVHKFNLTELCRKRVGVLSGGMARRLLIARALLPEPRLLLLDEPTVGLDPDVRQDIWAMIRGLVAAGTTIFMTTHYMEEAEQLCQRVALLKAGQIVAVDTPAGIKRLADAESGNDQQTTLETAFLRLIREGQA